MLDVTLGIIQSNPYFLGGKNKWGLEKLSYLVKVIELVNGEPNLLVSRVLFFSTFHISQFLNCLICQSFYLDWVFTQSRFMWESDLISEKCLIRNSLLLQPLLFDYLMLLPYLHPSVAALSTLPPSCLRGRWHPSSRQILFSLNPTWKSHFLSKP